MDELLGPVLGAQVTWSATDDPIPDSPMARCFAEVWQIHKNDNYIPVYDKTFAPYRDRIIRMLEIGVSRGGSLELWRKYFTSESIIVGIDINPACTKFDNPDRNLYVRTGDQQDTAFLQAVIDELGPFDIILDDGSHLPAPTLTAFQHLFAHGLRDGGVYLVEDLWFCYMPIGQDQYCPTFVEVIKHLIDVMHQAWAGHNTLDAFDGGRAELLESEPGSADQILFGVRDWASGGPNAYRVMKHCVPLATTLISAIQLHDGIVAIHRQPRQVPRVLLNVSGPDFPSE